jgi:hypothetical protein
MKTISGSTDKVGNLIRQTGPETSPPGMVERIIYRIEATTLKKNPDFSPVIGIRGWIFTGGFAIALILLFLLAGSNGESNGNSLFKAKYFFQSLQNLNLSFRFDFPVPKPLLFGLTGLLLWFGLDFILSTMKWKRDTSKEQP